MMIAGVLSVLLFVLTVQVLTAIRVVMDLVLIKQQIIAFYVEIIVPNVIVILTILFIASHAKVDIILFHPLHSFVISVCKIV